MFLKVLQIPQENTCFRVYFFRKVIKLYKIFVLHEKAILLRFFSPGRGMGEISPTSQKFAHPPPPPRKLPPPTKSQFAPSPPLTKQFSSYIPIKTAFLAVVIVPTPFLF